MHELVSRPQQMVAQQHLIGEKANAVADANRFVLYRLGKSQHTVEAQKQDLTTFERYLDAYSVGSYDLFNDPSSWSTITHGLVQHFQLTLLNMGYSVGSINRILSTVRVYAKHSAMQEKELRATLDTIKKISPNEQAHIDADRPTSRIGSKKALTTYIDKHVLQEVMELPENPTKRQSLDCLLLSILIEMGLRIGEVHALTREQFNTHDMTLTFFREKVSKSQQHALPRQVIASLQAVTTLIPDVKGPLWVSLSKNDTIGPPVSCRALQKRVTTLFSARGIQGVSPHDLRHWWVTDIVRSGTDIEAAMSAGGWKTPAMVTRYVEAGKIANEHVKKSY